MQTRVNYESICIYYLRVLLNYYSMGFSVMWEEMRNNVRTCINLKSRFSMKNFQST